MAWFKKEDLPEELQGKTPEEIKTYLAQQKKDADDAKAALATANAAAETQKTEFEGVKSRLASIEANRTNANANTNNNTQREPKEPTSFLVDEDAAFNERVAPVVNLALHGAAMSARMMAFQSIPAREQKLFNKYASEVEGIMAKESPERKVYAQTWLNAWTYVKGLHTQELVDAAAKGDNAFFAESGSSTGNVAGNGHEDKKDELTDAEKDIARKMKISPEAYLKNKKGISLYVG